jgi:hypothetical protein
MNEKDAFALVPRPAGALETAEPGARRILSGMVADALVLAREGQPAKRAFSAAICGNHGGVDDILAPYLRDVILGEPAVELSIFTYADDLLKVAGAKAFDLVFVFLNPDIPRRDDDPDARQLVGSLKSKFQRPVIIISNEYTYGREGASAFIKAGADAFFPMPFELEHLGLALVGWGIKLKD